MHLDNQHLKTKRTMTFEQKEFAAIVRLAISMAAADGVFAENEKKAIALELARFGVSESNMP